jgi:hypothetical protein
MDDFNAWYKSQPIIIRTYLSIAFIFSVLITLGVVNYELLLIQPRNEIN